MLAWNDSADDTELGGRLLLPADCWVLHGNPPWLC